MSDADKSHEPKLLDNIFRDYAGPTFAVRLWNGWQRASVFGERPVFTVVVETPNALRALMTEPNEVTLGEVFIRRKIDVEGDIFSVFSVAEYLISRPRGLPLVREDWYATSNREHEIEV